MTKNVMTSMRLNGKSYDLQDLDAQTKIKELNEVTIPTKIQNDAVNGLYSVNIAMYPWSNGESIIATKVRNPSKDAKVYHITKDADDNYVMDYDAELKITEVFRESNKIIVNGTEYTKIDEPVVIKVDTTIKQHLDMLTRSIGNNNSEAVDPLTIVTADDVTFNNDYGFGPAVHDVDKALEALWNKCFYAEPLAPVIHILDQTPSADKPATTRYVGQEIPARTLPLKIWITNPNGSLGIDPNTITMTNAVLSEEEIQSLANGEEIQKNISLQAILNSTTLSYTVKAKSNADSKGKSTEGSQTFKITYNFYNHHYKYQSASGSYPDLGTLPDSNSLNYDNAKEYTIRFTSTNEYLMYITTKTIKSVKDKVTGFDVTGDWVLQSERLNYNGINYKVYKTATPKTLTEFDFIITVQ